MIISKGDIDFEVTIQAVDDGEWEGRIIEYNLSRMLPTPQLQHQWVSLEAALAGVMRRWQRLFPEDPQPDFRQAIKASTQDITQGDVCN